MELVSVIIPVYNTGKYIYRCLESIINQTYANIEIVVVDNNSTDDSVKIIKKYAKKDSRIRLEYEDEQGQGAARDRGVDIAKGEWICFIDSDDFVHKKYVEILLAAVKTHGCLLAKCRHKKVNDSINLKNYEIDEHSEPKLMTLQEYFFYLYCHESEGAGVYGETCEIIHRSILASLRHDKLRFAEDSYMAPRIGYYAAERPIAVLDTYLYYYYQRNNSTLHSLPSMVRLDRYYAKRAALDFWREKNETELYELFFTDFYNCMIQDYLDLSVFCPEQSDQYAFLKNEILKNYDKARELGAEYLNIKCGAKEKWHKICELNGNLIQYGYGNKGKEIFQRLRALDIDINEIWDKDPENAGKNDNKNVLPHEIDGGVNFIIAIEDIYIGHEVKRFLEKYDPRLIIRYDYLYSALQYGIYEKYLPFLLQNYL